MSQHTSQDKTSREAKQTRQENKTRQDNKTTHHEDKTVKHDNMTNNKTKFTTTSRYQKRTKRLNNNFGDDLWGGRFLKQIKNKTRQDEIRQDKTRRHNKTTHHEGKTVRHDKMTNNNTRFTTKSRYQKRPKRQDNNFGAYLRLNTLRCSRGGGRDRCRGRGRG